MMKSDNELRKYWLGFWGSVYFFFWALDPFELGSRIGSYQNSCLTTGWIEKFLNIASTNCLNYIKWFLLKDFLLILPLIVLIFLIIKKQK